MGGPREREFIRNFNRLKPSIQRYFAMHGFNREDCEDLTQDTFLQAHKGLDGFRGQSEFKTWLFTIAGNVYRKAIRHRKALKRDRLETTPDEDFSEQQVLESASMWDSAQGGRPAIHEGEQLESILVQERFDLVSRALEDLPPKMRRCILMYVNQERKYREIADLMNLSINTVKSHIHEARSRLRRTLGDHFDGFGR